MNSYLRIRRSQFLEMKPCFMVLHLCGQHFDEVISTGGPQTLQSTYKIFTKISISLHNSSKCKYLSVQHFSVCRSRVFLIVWLKSFILIATYHLYLCFGNFHFGCNRSDYYLFFINACWLCLLRHQSTNLLLAGSNLAPSKTSIKVLLI